MNKKQKILKNKKMLKLARKLKRKRIKNCKDDVAEGRFPLLRLPILAVQNCIRIFTVFQFLDFSLLSKRAKTIASTIRRNQIGINLRIGEESRIHLTLPNHPNNVWLIDFRPDFSTFKKLVPRKMNGTTVLSAVRTNTVITVTGEKKKMHRLVFPQKKVLAGIKWMTEQLSVVFRSPIRLLDIEYFEDPLIHLFKWLHSFQKAIDSISITGEEISAKAILLILNNFQIKRQLTLYVKLTDDSFKYSQPINTHSLSFGFSQWSLSNILCSENSSIALSNSSLTPEDINCLIKHWIGGWNENLCYLELIRNVENEEVEEEVFKIITKDIEWREHSNDSGRPMHRDLYEGGIQPMYQGEHAEIERSGGRIAAFAQIYQHTDGKELHHFRFQAWHKK